MFLHYSIYSKRSIYVTLRIDYKKRVIQLHVQLILLNRKNIKHVEKIVQTIYFWCAFRIGLINNM